MRLAALAALASVTAGTAHAAPVYLECKISSGTQETVWNVSLDEAAGSVSYAIPSMNVNQKHPGVFTADKVVFNGIEINRVDLSMTRETRILSKTRVDRGQCELAKAPDRKF